MAEPFRRPSGGVSKSVRDAAPARSAAIRRHRGNADPGARARPRDQRPLAPRRSTSARLTSEGVFMEIAATLERIKAAVGPRGWIADPRETEPYLVEARGLYRGATGLVVRPASAAEVAAVVRICAETKLPIVPQGGNTGLVGGGGPPEGGHHVGFALGRMNRIRAIDPVNF